ncbi:MAG: hypothetical protein ABIP81_07420, partial [Terriglobales bacterium]
MRMIRNLIWLAALSAVVTLPLAAQEPWQWGKPDFAGPQGAVGAGGAGVAMEARADAAFMAKNFKDAAELYADVLEDQPLNGKAWFRLGFAQNS